MQNTRLKNLPNPRLCEGIKTKAMCTYILWIKILKLIPYLQSQTMINIIA
jgi:hypothetical protein